MPQPPLRCALLSLTMWPTPKMPMPSPPLPSASLPSSLLPRPAGAVSSTSMPSPELSLAVLRIRSLSADMLSIEMPEPSVPLALLISTRLPTDSPISMPPLLPARLFARMTVSRASSSMTAVPSSAAMRFSSIAVAGRVDDDDAAAVAGDRVARDDVVVGRDQLLADRDAALVVLHHVVGDEVLAAALHEHAGAAGAVDLVVLDPVPARVLHPHAVPGAAADRVVADDRVARAAVERDADPVEGELVAADGVAVGRAVRARLVGVGERDAGLLVELQAQVGHDAAAGAGAELDAVVELGDQAVGDGDVVEAGVEDAGVEPDAVDQVAVEVERDPAAADDQAVALAVDEVVGELDALDDDLAADHLGLHRRRLDLPRPLGGGADVGRHVEVRRAHLELVHAGAERRDRTPCRGRT